MWRLDQIAPWRALPQAQPYCRHAESNRKEFSGALSRISPIAVKIGSFSMLASGKAVADQDRPSFFPFFVMVGGGKPAFPRCLLITTKKRKKIHRKCCGQRPVIRPVADHAFSAGIFLIF